MPDLTPVRFYAILDTGYVGPDQWAEKCRQLIAGGADLVQVRAKAETLDERRRLLHAILPLFDPDSNLSPHGRPPRLIVNDDIDLCLEYPGLGLHVGQDDLPVTEARRRLGPERILGLSTHSIEQAENAISLVSQLSYFAVGPVFPTPTKPDYSSVGLELVEHVAGRRPPLPFFCIGGIKLTNVRDVLRAGAKRVVVVSEVLQAPDSAKAVSAFRRILAD